MKSVQERLVPALGRTEGDPEVIEKGPSSFSWADRSARNLGWFSHALGLAELVAPGRLATALGMEGKEGLIRAYGVREVGAGLGALSVTKTPAIWSRVAGDALDLATLAAHYRNDNPKKKNVGMALVAVAGVTALDIVTALALSSQQSRKGEARDYSDRTGFPKGVAASRGIARDHETPRDMRADLPDVGKPEGSESKTEAGNPGEFRGATQPDLAPA